MFNNPFLNYFVLYVLFLKIASWLCSLNSIIKIVKQKRFNWFFVYNYVILDYLVHLVLSFFQGQGRHYLPKPWHGLWMFPLLLQMPLHSLRQVGNSSFLFIVSHSFSFFFCMISLVTFELWLARDPFGKNNGHSNQGIFFFHSNFLVIRRMIV